jgi:phage-related holin
MLKLTYQRRRLLVVLAGVPFVLCLCNFYFDGHFFGKYDLTALVLSSILLFVVLSYIGPTVEETRAYKHDKKNRNKQEPQ